MLHIISFSSSAPVSQEYKLMSGILLDKDHRTARIIRRRVVHKICCEVFDYRQFG